MQMFRPAKHTCMDLCERRGRVRGHAVRVVEPLASAMVALRCPAISEVTSERAVRAVTCRAAIPLIAACARQAFVGIPHTGLVRLAKHRGCQVVASASTYTMVAELVKHSLGIVDGPELFEIVKRQVDIVVPNIDMLMEVDEAVAVLNQDDKEEVKKHRRAQHKHCEGRSK